MNEQARAYWESFAATLEEAPVFEDVLVFPFGADPETQRECAELVLCGKKTATASLRWVYDAYPEEPIPRADVYSVVLDETGSPVAILQNTEVRVAPFDEVSAEHAFLEGEGDRTLAYWREVHWRFFAESCASIGREPHPKMPILLERFVVRYPGS